MRSLFWILITVSSAVLWAACFASEPLLVAPWVALTPFFLLLVSPRPALLALSWGFVYWLVSLSWIPPTLVTFGDLPAAGAWGLFSLLALYLALYPWACALLVGPSWRRLVAGAERRSLVRSLLAVVATAATWGVLEWLRGWLFGGFPWNLAAYAWIGTPGALEASAWIGAYGISALLVATNAAIAAAVVRRSWRPAAWGVLVPLALLATAWRWNVHGELEARRAPVPPGERLAVRIVQPDIPNLRVWDPQRNYEDYRRLIALSVEACDRPGALVVWPESAAFPRRLDRDADLDRDLGAITSKGCSVLLNTVRQGAAGEIYNAAVVLSPDGTRVEYDKEHLVPWGEYVPLGSVFPVVESLARNAGEFTPGTELRLLDVDGQRLGAAICYEVVFPRHAAAAVRAGATALVSITNDDWYGPTAARWQHLRAARFRAAETRRTLLRGAITGVSAVVGPDGAVVAEALPGERRVLRADVVPRHRLTPYVRFGRLLPALLALVGAFAIFLAGGASAWTRRKHSRRSTA